MFEVALIVALPVATLIAYLIGRSRGHKEAEQVCAVCKYKSTQDEDTPLYNLMALKYPKVFMSMKSERL